MKIDMILISLSLALVVGGAGCSGSTGSGLVTFNARAGGSGSAEFDTGMGYHVSLTQATLHLGALYLNLSAPSSGAPERPCVEPGIYVGEAFANFDVDLLSSDTTTFSGEGTANPAVEAEVWLTSGDVNAASDPTPVFTAAGSAEKNGASWPFSATVTIEVANRGIPAGVPAMPGANPICQQRIVSRIPVALQLAGSGTLDLRIDAAGMFNAVDFGADPPAGLPADGVIPDANGGIGGDLFSGVTANSGVYQFSFTNKESP
jgi:hypothetical protein